MDLQNDSEEEPIEFGDWAGQEYGRECEHKEKISKFWFLQLENDF